MSELIFSVRSALRTLFLDLCSIVYKLIVVCYNVFERIGTANILQDSDIFQKIANRIGLILGLFMVFRITFSFIQYIINPDNMTDKNKGIGNIVKRVLISIVLLGSVSGMFTLAYKFQNLLIEDNVIPNIIFNESEYDTENFGNRLSSMLFFSFFRYEEDDEYEMSTSDLNREAQDCIALEDAMKIDVENYSNYELVFTCVGAKAEYTNHATGETEEKFVYTFDGGGLLALAVGLFALYSIFIFTIQVGVRLIQLAYLQLISPVPIMMYITPKGEDKLKKWGNQCLTTFLDYFLRSAIIYFVIFLINILMSSRDSGINDIWTGNTGTDAYILVILILALFTFAKKVPNLIKEVLPSLGGAASFDYGLNFKKNVAEPFKSLYNSPIGWGLKTPMAIGRGVDRVTHGKSFFGESKLRKSIDKAFPEQAAEKKKIAEAKQVLNDNNEFESYGKRLFSKYGDELPSSAFSNEQYKASYEEVGAAKGETKITSKNLRDATAQFNAAYNSGNSEKIAEAREKLDAAEKADKTAQARFEKAKETHDQMKKIYSSDAKIENAYKYYTDRNPGEVDKWKAEHQKNKIEKNIENNHVGNNQNDIDFGEGPLSVDNNDNPVPKKVSVKRVNVVHNNSKQSSKENNN